RCSSGFRANAPRALRRWAPIRRSRIGGPPTARSGASTAGRNATGDRAGHPRHQAITASWLPALAGFAFDVGETDAVGGDVDQAEHDGEAEAAGADRAGVEDGEVAIAADERDVRVAAYDERGAFAGGELAGVFAELGAVDGDVREEQREL